MKRKILYIDQPIAPLGGGQISLLLVLQNLDKAKYEPAVFFPREGEFAVKVRSLAIPCRAVPARKLHSAIKRLGPDIVHGNAATTRYTFWSALAAKRAGIPFVWHVRVIESAGWRDRIIAGLSKKIIVISEAVKEKFDGLRNGAKVQKIYNGAATNVFRPGLEVGDLRERLRLGKDKKIIGVFSRIDPWKGHRLFLAAAKIIRERAADTIFLIVGGGRPKDKDPLLEEVGSLGLTEDVVFTGFRDDVPELMNLCDVIVNPSVEPEPFGRVIIEAMACGKAVVAFNTGGQKEIIVNNVTGVLVPEQNARALAQACLDLLENSAKAREMGARGRARVEELFSAEANIAGIERLYEELLH